MRCILLSSNIPGDPNPRAGEPGAGSNPMWPPYDTDKDELLALDIPIEAVAGVRKDRCDFWDDEAAKGPM